MKIAQTSEVTKQARSYLREYACLLGVLTLCVISYANASNQITGWLLGICFTSCMLVLLYVRTTRSMVVGAALGVCSLVIVSIYMNLNYMLLIVGNTAVSAGILYVFLRLLRLLDQSREQQMKLDHLAHHDMLTGLPNRRLFDDRLNQALLRARRGRQLMAVLFLDLDKFKEVNDTLGHASGDILIKDTGARILSCLREGDTVFRQGGDEFTILLEYLTKPEDVRVVVSRIQAALEKAFYLHEHTRYVTASIGIALYPNDGETIEQLMINADNAMYRAKESGRNKYKFFATELDTSVASKVQLENALVQAMVSEELELRYQPQYEVISQALVGMEVHISWVRKHAIIPPVEWYSIAEESGLIVQISEWALLKACHEMKGWQEDGLPALKLSMQLSLYHFKQDNLVARITHILNEAKLEAKYVELDLAEGISSLSIQQVTEKLEELKLLGVGIAMDDLCAGLFAISTVKQLPMDTLKLDSALIRDLHSDQENQTLTVAIIAMAERLNMNLIAKGVETKEQLDLLQKLNCKEAQGCLFGNPLSASEIRGILEASRVKKITSV